MRSAIHFCNGWTKKIQAVYLIKEAYPLSAELNTKPGGTESFVSDREMLVNVAVT